MEKQTFSDNLIKAVETLLPFAQSFLIEKFPLEFQFVVFLSQSYDNIDKLIGDETLFPKDSLKENKVKIFHSTEQIVEFLWRNRKIPEWINLFIHSFDDEKTNIAVICCGRFTADEKLLYHENEGYQPFHILGPYLPPNYSDSINPEKFNFFWHGRKPNLDELYY
jgi:hypothetical protein